MYDVTEIWSVQDLGYKGFQSVLASESNWFSRAVCLPKCFVSKYLVDVSQNGYIMRFGRQENKEEHSRLFKSGSRKGHCNHKISTERPEPMKHQKWKAWRKRGEVLVLELVLNLSRKTRLWYSIWPEDFRVCYLHNAEFWILVDKQKSYHLEFNADWVYVILAIHRCSVRWVQNNRTPRHDHEAGDEVRREGKVCGYLKIIETID